MSPSGVWLSTNSDPQEPFPLEITLSFFMAKDTTGFVCFYSKGL